MTECIAELKVVGGKIDDGENILSGDSNTEIIIQKLTDISRMKAELKEANNERELLQRQLESEKYARLSAEG